MSYTGSQHFYWQNSWLCPQALQGGLFAMTFKG